MSDYLQQLHDAHKKRMSNLLPSRVQIIPVPKAPAPFKVRNCLRLIAQTYNSGGKPVTIEDMLSNTRKRPVVRARNVAIYLIRKSSKLSLPAIGRHFNKHHATILWSILKVQRMVDQSPIVREEIERLLQEITCSSSPQDSAQTTSGA
jgi:chromosomal replication initiation ATPase DnaA